MSLLRAAATVSGFTMISRLTGFARDVLIAAVIGVGPISDAFFVAFKIPNMFRRITAEGAFTVVFVPMFSAALAEDGKAPALKFAEEILALMAAGLVAFFAVMIFAMPQLMTVMAPGFAATPERFELAVELTRITFIYLPLISIVALLGGILNSIDKFAAMASSPILLNLILITAIVVFAKALETPGHALAWGVAAAGLAQFLWVLEACRRAGVRPGLRLPRLTPPARRLFRRMMPAVAGVAVVHANTVIDIILASLLATGSVSFLYYADRVNQLPLGVVAVALGTALLPALSREVKAGREEEAGQILNRALGLGAFLILPATAGLMVLGDLIIEVLFQRGAFSPAAVSSTAAALIAYAAGLPAFLLIKLFQTAFFARADTATPVRIAVVAVVVNLILNLILMQFYAHVGLAMASAISGWVNAGLLIIALRRRGNYRFARDVWSRIARMAAATGVMVGALIGVASLLTPWFAGSPWWLALLLGVLTVGGGLVYLAAAILFGALSLDDMRARFGRARFNRGASD